ncbi:hypothetical protein [Panacagrimonas sp.]|uniref:hypothetical protein n=1 Tax=Panacagrimonas sp. TaxID=2480088 RepID=UPI003B526D09
MSDKIHQIPTKPDKALALTEELRRTLPTLIANARMIAQLKKAQYDAYVEAGFTPQQALELIKTT